MSMLAVSVRILEKDETLKLVYQPSQKFGQGIGKPSEIVPFLRLLTVGHWYHPEVAEARLRSYYWE